MTKGKVVIGLGFGDEGKGLTTSFLCSQAKDPIVVRFNGGHQAGHTVRLNEKRHVFSNFGSGTLQGIPTYWSQFCTFNPTGFMNEFLDLKNKNKTSIPDFFINPLCPVTTPYDIFWNRIREKNSNHGSVGVGFGATIERQENYFKLHIQDLFYPSILEEKLKNIKGYYISKFRNQFGYSVEFPDLSEECDGFMISVQFIKEMKLVQISDDSCLDEKTPIFEGAQGILLDMDFGFFPNVTRSNTTSKNALEIKECEEIYYVTRSYLTRHGNGFIPNEKDLSLINNEFETNKQHEFQGPFKTAELDLDLINYALDCDRTFSEGIKKNLVITCIDQHPIDVDELIRGIKTKFEKIYISRGDSPKDIELYSYKIGYKSNAEIDLHSIPLLSPRK